MQLFKNKWTWIVGILFLLIVLFKFGCKKDTTQKVAIEKAQLRNIVETVDETGKIYPTTEMKIGVDAGATVQDIYVQDGDTVRKGDAIAIIQSNGTTIVPATKSYTPPTGMQGGQMNPAAIAQALQQATQPATPTVERTTKTTTIYAPMNGIINNITAKKGERIMGNELAKVISINEWEVLSEIGEVDIVKIKEGNEVAVKIEALANATLSGTVYRITNNSNNALGNNMLGGADVTNYKVYIKINKASLDSVVNVSTNYTLRSGMNASIKIQTNTKNNIVTIPIKAVTTRYENEENNAKVNKKAKSETVVFVYNNGTVKKRVVSTGIQDIEYIEILSGLQNGDVVIVEPYEAIEKNLQNDMKVKVVDAKDLFKK
jgi:HlyD family secretion protein